MNDRPTLRADKRTENEVNFGIVLVRAVCGVLSTRQHGCVSMNLSSTATADTCVHWPENPFSSLCTTVEKFYISLGEESA